MKTVVNESLSKDCGYPSLSSVKPCICFVPFFEFGLLKCHKKANNIEFAQEKRFKAFIFKKFIFLKFVILVRVYFKNVRNLRHVASTFSCILILVQF